jgi:hypothetical protein
MAMKWLLLIVLKKRKIHNSKPSYETYCGYKEEGASKVKKRMTTPCQPNVNSHI